MADDRSSGEVVPETRKAGSESIKTRITDFVRLGVVGLFAYWSLTLVAPFAVLVIWAGILAVALYPVYTWLRASLGGRGRLAAFLVTLVGLLVIIGPLEAIVLNFVDAAQHVLTKLQSCGLTLPMPAGSVKQCPLIGERVFTAWSRASSNLGGALFQMKSSLIEAGTVVLGKVAGVGGDLLGFVASVILGGFFLKPGPQLGDGLKGFAHRIAPGKGVGFVQPGRCDNSQRGARSDRHCTAADAAFGAGPEPFRRAGTRADRLCRPDILHCPDRPCAASAAGRHLGVDRMELAARARPYALPDPPSRHRQRDEADTGCAGPCYADVGDPCRRDRRHALLRVGRVIPRADRSQRCLRPTLSLGAAAGVRQLREYEQVALGLKHLAGRGDQQFKVICRGDLHNSRWFGRSGISPFSA